MWNITDFVTVPPLPSVFVRAWHRLHFFPRLEPVTCLQFSRAWHKLHVFPRLALVTIFPAVGIGYLFSRAWHQLHGFPRLAPVTCFHALGTDYRYTVSRNWRSLGGSPRLAPVTWFPTRLLIGSLRYLSYYDWSITIKGFLWVVKS